MKKLKWCKSDEEWDLYVVELEERTDLNPLKDKDNRISVDKTFEVLKYVYNDHFDRHAGGLELGCGAFVLGLVYADCLDFDKMCDALHRLAVNKDDNRIPLYDYSKYDLAIMDIIKNVFTRIDKKF